MRWCALVGVVLSATTDAWAVTSTRAVHQALFHAGMNPTADGQVMVAHAGNAFQIRAFRGQRVQLSDGFTDPSQAYSDPTELYDTPTDLGPPAVCEVEAQPRPCTRQGFIDSSGKYACYDLVIFFVNDVGTYPVIARRPLFVVVSAPHSADAAIEKFEWRGAAEALSEVQHGIEPTLTSDGHLLAFNQFDRLRYSYNASPCARDGWAKSQYLGAMASDANVIGTYKLADKPLRAADGEVYDGQSEFHGAYPWLFPDGSAILYTTAVLPCRVPAQPAGCNLLPGPTTCVSFEDPPGCPGRRSALTVIGYPTNWAAAHIDGEVNPARDDFLRLLFASPGPGVAPYLPLTKGVDVWPLFGGVSQNYTELVFDDGLDGRYGGLWHMNELLTRDGEFDVSRVADSSGYLNTGKVVIRRQPGTGLIPGGGIGLNGRNNAVSLSHQASHHPVDRLVVDFWLRLTTPLDCDGANNFHPLVQKGDPNVAGYSVVIEQDRLIRARVRVDGETYTAASTLRPTAGAWSRVTFSYDSTNGVMQFRIDDNDAGRFVQVPRPMVATTDPLLVGGPPGSFSQCNVGGVFEGEMAELTISNAAPIPAFVSPSLNNGLLGKAIEFDGAGRAYVAVPHAASLNPVNSVTLQMAVKPSADPDCDEHGNWRVLLAKGDAITGAYSLVLEEDLTVRARFHVAGDKVYEIGSQRALQLNAWSQLTASYEGETGTLLFYVDAEETARVQESPAVLQGNDADLVMGGTASATTACANGDGGFAGTIDEVAISRIVRAPKAPAALHLPQPGEMSTEVTLPAQTPTSPSGTSLSPTAASGQPRVNLKSGCRQTGVGLWWCLALVALRQFQRRHSCS